MERDEVLVERRALRGFHRVRERVQPALFDLLRDRPAEVLRDRRRQSVAGCAARALVCHPVPAMRAPLSSFFLSPRVTPLGALPLTVAVAVANGLTHGARSQPDVQWRLCVENNMSLSGRVLSVLVCEL